MINDCYCDYELPDFYRVLRRRARHLHRCLECHREIPAGEIYERAVGKWDGFVETYKTCSTCLALRDWVEAHIPCFCWTHGNIREDAIETARAYADEAPGLLFGTYRREVAIMRHRRKMIH